MCGRLLRLTVVSCVALTAGVFIAGCAKAPGADVTGGWIMQYSGPDHNFSAKWGLTNKEKNKVDGNFMDLDKTGGYIMGKVSGNTFEGKCAGYPMGYFVKFTMTVSGDEMKGTWSDSENKTGELKGTRQKE